MVVSLKKKNGKYINKNYKVPVWSRLTLAVLEKTGVRVEFLH